MDKTTEGGEIMKVFAWIALVLTAFGGLYVVADLVQGIDTTTNIFALAYMLLLVYVIYPITKK